MNNIIFEITGLKPGEHFAIEGANRAMNIKETTHET